MAKLVFKNGVVEDYTIVLCTRDKRMLGQLTGLKGVNYKGNLNSAHEMSFSISKHDLLKFNGNVDYDIQRYKKVKNELWKRIQDLRLIWVKELDKYFEIKVRTNDTSTEAIKYITATHLCEAELSQALLETLEINTETDPFLTKDANTVFYNPDDVKHSLLNRVISDKAPHYKIKHVDESLKNIVRTFSVSGQYIYDFLQGECAEQIKCLFVFDSRDRSISAYDLMAVCQDCGNRHEDYNVCPKCGSVNNKYFGKDTGILVTKDNLTDDIQCEVDADNIKNCFKLVAGDDLMTATVKMLNNGSDYITYFSEMQREDMPKGLVDKLDAYDIECDKYSEEYNKLVTDYYKAIDLELYLTSGMMPTPEIGGVTAQTEASKLTYASLSPIGVSQLIEGKTSIDTITSAVKNYAKVLIKSGYVKLDVSNASFEYSGKNEENGVSSGYWSGTFTITSYADEEDIVTKKVSNVLVHDNYIDFVEQKLLKQMNEKDEEGSIYDVFSISYPDDRERELKEFTDALQYYCKNRLVSFYDAIEGALLTLAELGQAQSESLLYSDLYEPYKKKKEAVNDALVRLQSGTIRYKYDDVTYNKNLDQVVKMKEESEQKISEIQNKLDLKEYLGGYYPIFCSYKREDVYSNDNYISDGLSNDELIERAEKFIEAAKKEIYKSGEKQINISSTIYNLLVMEEFKPIVDQFELGNWIRVLVDGQLYRLRLLSYYISFDSLQTIGVEFSTASKIKDLAYEAEQIQKSVTSLATGYSYVSEQAQQGAKAQSIIQDTINNGLSSALVQIKNNDKTEVVMDEYGLLGRSWDDIENSYDPRQVRLSHNSILFTADNWESVEQAIGEHKYVYYDQGSNTWISSVGYGFIARFLNAAHIMGSTIVGGMIYSANYEINTKDERYKTSENYDYNKYYCNGSFIDLQNGDFSFGGQLIWDGTNLIIDDTTISDAVKGIEVTAENLSIRPENIITDDENKIQPSQINQTDLTIQANNIDIRNGKIPSSKIDSSGLKITSNNFSDGKIYADEVPARGIDTSDGLIESYQITATLSDKSLSDCSLYGSVNVSDGTNLGVGVTGSYTIGNTVLKFINGICVGVTQSS